MTDVIRSDDGFTVDACLIGDALGIDPAHVPALMRQGRITSRCETGEGADAGRFRLSFFHGARTLRLTISTDGTILKRALFDSPAR